MLRALKWLVLGSITLAVMVWVVMNRHAVTLHLYPLPYEIELPVYLLAALFLVIGFALATLLTNLQAIRRYSKNRYNQQRLHALEQEVEGLRQQQTALSAPTEAQ